MSSYHASLHIPHPRSLAYIPLQLVTSSVIRPCITLFTASDSIHGHPTATGNKFPLSLCHSSLCIMYLTALGCILQHRQTLQYNGYQPLSSCHSLQLILHPRASAYIPLQLVTSFVIRLYITSLTASDSLQLQLVSNILCPHVLHHCT